VQGQDEDLGAEPRADLTLLSRTAAGDRDAFDALVARHHAAVQRLARTLTRSAAAADDVTQETFLSAWRHAGSFQGTGSVRGWLLTIAHHAAGRHLRRKAGEPADPLPLEDLGLAAGYGAEPAAETPTPETDVAEAERRRALKAALDALPDADREILVLRDLEGLTGPEAAEALGLTLAAMKTRLHRARLKLMAALHEGGFDEG
jgi:RNA polymerase sigma-70 factor (ECF subfamily)